MIGLCVFLILQRRTKSGSQSTNPPFENDLPEMDTVGEGKPAFLGGVAKQSGWGQASESPAEHIGAAELSSARSVIHKRPKRAETKSMPAELSSDDRAGAVLGSPRQAQMAELPTGVAELSAEPRSDKTY